MNEHTAEALRYILLWAASACPVQVVSSTLAEGCGGCVTGLLRALNPEVMTVWSGSIDGFMMFPLAMFEQATNVELLWHTDGTRITITFPLAMFQIADYSEGERFGHA